MKNAGIEPATPGLGVQWHIHWATDSWNGSKLVYKALVRNDNSLIPLGVKAVVLETCLNPPRGRGEKRIGTLAGEDAKLGQYVYIRSSYA